MTEVRILTSHLGWILEAFARESANAYGEQIHLTRMAVRRREYINPRNWPLAKFLRLSKCKLLFLHHETLVRNKQSLLGRDARVLLTHFEESRHINPQLLMKLRQVSRIIVQNKAMSELLIESGVAPSKIRVGYGAVDRTIYFPEKARSPQDFMLIVGDCKPRKNPELISQVILGNLDRKFVIHGLHWDRYLPEKVLDSPNLSVVKFSKSKNPLFMRQARLLLSLSLNEGGPIPVLEALASGTPVLATDTGFCKEVIPTDYGAVIPTDSNPEEVSLLIDKLWKKKDECWSRIS